jgi:hypothetical protein
LPDVELGALCFEKAHDAAIVLEDVELPPFLKSLLWFDFRDPARDEEATAELVHSMRPARASRKLADVGQVGAFPRPPVHRFQGRARELHKLEQLFRAHRATSLHAMGGMGKTSLAGEAAAWWTRTGLFPDGACFLSFEQGPARPRGPGGRRGHRRPAPGEGRAGPAAGRTGGPPAVGRAGRPVPWLGLFRGGVFEEILLDVSGIAPAAWDGVRAELEATARVRVERETLLN